MIWIAPTADDVLGQFTPAESAVLQRLQGAEDKLPGILALVVAEVRDYIRSGGYALDEDDATTLPKGLHNDAIAIARWRYLISIPAAKQLQTEEREAANDRSEKKLDKIAAGRFRIELPTVPAAGAVSIPAGTWNSENKIIGRNHPVPRPAVQSAPQDGRYANPSGPEDQA